MKFMNLKRFASTVLAGVMALSLAVPALAAGNTPANTTEITGTYEEIPIAVSVPTTGTAQINPYGLPISVPKSDETTVDLVNQQITTRPLNIKNQGTVDLDVDATLTVLPKGDVGIAASAGASDKNIKVDLEVVGLDDSTLAVSAEDESLENKLIDKFANKDTWTSSKKLGAPVATKGTTTAPTPAKSAGNATISPMATLGAATVTDGAITYGDDSIALFRLSGACSKAPQASGADDPWKDTDGFTATVVFKFAPATPRAGDATLTLAPATLTAAGNVTATFDAKTSGRSVASLEWTSSDSDKASVSGAAALTGNTATATVSDGTIASGDSVTITVTATLDNGATLTATATYNKS